MDKSREKEIRTHLQQVYNIYVIVGLKLTIIMSDLSADYFLD